MTASSTNSQIREIEIIRQRLKPIFAQNNVEKAILFGAMARGTATRRSDVDIAVIVATKKRFFDRFEDFEPIHELIEGRTVDLLIYSPEEFASISHRPFVQNILKEGVLLYGS